MYTIIDLADKCRGGWKLIPLLPPLQQPCFVFFFRQYLTDGYTFGIRCGCFFDVRTDVSNAYIRIKIYAITTENQTRTMSETEGQVFGQKRPPLYQIITNILREYPSGQIFKVNDAVLLFQYTHDRLLVYNSIKSKL